MSTEFSHLPQPPPRSPDEPSATQEQLEELWSLGYQDHQFLNTLGVDQARYLIFGNFEGAAPQKGKRWRRLFGILGLLFILGGGDSLWNYLVEGKEPTLVKAGRKLGEFFEAAMAGSSKEEPSPTPETDPLEPGKVFTLRKPVGVRVDQGVLVLQAGRPVKILEKKGDRVIFQHDFGRAEAARSELLP